jgi:hypothetical protein
MKLYTEEQVKNFLKERTFIREETIDAMCDTLTPIELPSDEQVGVIALNIADTLKDSLDSREEAFYLAGFKTCAKWLKEQILNQNK